MTYAKAAAAVLAAGASAVLAALTGDQVISPLEWINVLIAIASALTVFAAPNVPGAAVTKFVVAAIMAGLTAAANLVTDAGPTSWWQLVTAAVGAALVYAVRNTAESPPVAV
ncbi:hypothetical protein [Amycolatopsis sp. NPDC021455]|uniref:hypothetical protein n=1 Tax=Amycolatopsis sp. NPDC021455 TaxID=3154901 RepID=UPI0033FFF033